MDLDLWRKLCTLPPHVLVEKARRKLGKWLSDAAARSMDRLRSSFALDVCVGPLTLRLANSSLPTPDANAARIVALLCDHYLAHRFDLLGSGWVMVKRGMRCPGLEGYRYEASFTCVIEDEYVGTPNLGECRRVRSLISADYQPIDWHLDFKSGYRWNPKTWYRDIPYGHLPGVDVKVPWELARMQHLPQMAHAYFFAGQRAGDFQARERYSSEFRNQVLDFVAANPPRYGVNWAYAIDVAIRIANWLLAYDLFRAAGASFDDGFETVFRRSVWEHGYHIVHNLEWSHELRGNHYLANICGLAFVAAYLQSDSEVDDWLAFAVQELINETLAQFNEDGSNFEGSTAYHGLSAELVVYTTALLLGLPEERRRALANDGHARARRMPMRQPIRSYTVPGDEGGSSFPLSYWQRLAGMARFIRTLTRPDGMIAQIGDNDSGRFFKLVPSVDLLTVGEARRRYRNLAEYRELPDDAPYPRERFLDQSHIVAAVRGIVDIRERTNASLDDSQETELVRLLARGIHARVSPREAMAEFGTGTNMPLPNATARRYFFPANGADLGAGLETISFPDFGVYVWRGRNLFLAIRSGAIGQNGFGGHSHNDQLGIELWIDGRPLVVDPGTYLYTPAIDLRNTYRSVRAHFAPQFGDGREPGSLRLGAFVLGDEAQGVCLTFDAQRFVGRHVGYGFPVYRQIELQQDGVSVVDWHEATGGAMFAEPRLLLPYSDGYGWIRQCD